MFDDLGIYATVFEKAFLDRTRLFYNQESRSMISLFEEGSAGAAVARYLVQVENRISSEKARCRDLGRDAGKVGYVGGGMGYLHMRSLDGLLAVLNNELIASNVSILLEKGMSF
jgi:hypothetical protein